MNDDNEEKCYGVSTDFIRQLTNFLFIIIGGKSWTNIPFRKKFVKKKAKHVYMDPYT